MSRLTLVNGVIPVCRVAGLAGSRFWGDGRSLPAPKAALKSKRIRLRAQRNVSTLLPVAANRFVDAGGITEDEHFIGFMDNDYPSLTTLLASCFLAASGRRAIGASAFLTCPNSQAYCLLECRL